MTVHVTYFAGKFSEKTDDSASRFYVLSISVNVIIIDSFGDRFYVSRTVSRSTSLYRIEYKCTQLVQCSTVLTTGYCR